jgi:cellulose synthase/poly-beta-1,6-N-acetylglucosamine synthase-like glycosyltransferase
MAVPISLTREVTASIRYLEEHVNNDTVQPVTFNASLRWARDASPAPWLYFLDDDTVMHEDLLIEVSRAMREEPQCPVVWVQQLRPGEVVLGVDDVRVGSIDTGQGILNLNEVRDQWFPLAAGYAADGALFEALNEEYGGRCRRTHKILSIYNALR